MKFITAFVEQTNIKHNRIKYTLMLCVASILYSMMLSFVEKIVYSGNLYSYYGALYLFVIWSAFIYMILLFLFIQKKRGITQPLTFKSYILPLFLVQTIFYILMLALGVGAYQVSVDSTLLRTITSTLSIVFSMLYIPWQVFCFFQIYDGKRNPFTILWNGIKKLVEHYRSCFYSLLFLFMIAWCYQIVLRTFFGSVPTFFTFGLIQDLMVNSNPFVPTIQNAMFISQSSQFWGVTLVSLVYGIIMCFVLVHYYMLMICIYDKDIKV